MNWVPEKLTDDVGYQIMTVHPSMAESRNGISRRVFSQGWKQPVYRISQDISGDVYVGILNAANRRLDANLQYIRG